MSSCGKNENPQEMNRRKFLKVFGGGAVASSAALYGCAQMIPREGFKVFFRNALLSAHAL